MHAFWLVLTYDLLEDRRTDDVIVKTFFNSLLYKTNRFQVAVRLFSNRSQMTSKFVFIWYRKNRLYVAVGLYSYKL